jgi:hypothetical protein
MSVVRRAGRRNRCFRLAQFRVAVEHELERGLRQRRRLLADGGDAPLRGHQAVAGLGVQLAAQQREQARLAAAVGADHADAPAVVQLQVALLD